MGKKSYSKTDVMNNLVIVYKKKPSNLLSDKEHESFMSGYHLAIEDLSLLFFGERGIEFLSKALRKK